MFTIKDSKGELIKTLGDKTGHSEARDIFRDIATAYRKNRHLIMTGESDGVKIEMVYFPKEYNKETFFKTPSEEFLNRLSEISKPVRI